MSPGSPLTPTVDGAGRAEKLLLNDASFFTSRDRPVWFGSAAVLGVSHAIVGAPGA